MFHTSIDPAPGADPKWDVIMWMDHRADKEASEINETGHRVLKFVGGKISLEMQSPKLLWLKRNMPGVFDTAAGFYDLSDWLTWKATGTNALNNYTPLFPRHFSFHPGGSKSRSLCSTVCKWTYEVTDAGKGWNKSFFEEIGLAELTKNDFEKLGTNVVR